MMDELKRREERQKDRRIVDGWDKARPMPPRCADPPKRGWQKYVSCRRCGSGISEAHWEYCPKCGQRILHASYAGTQGWTGAEAEAAWERIRDERQIHTGADGAPEPTEE